MAEKEEFDLIVTPRKHIFDINFADIWRYRDLLQMFVKRDIITVYKQTVLGPLWFFIQPIFTTLIYIVVFGTIAGIPTNGIPMPLFYLAGIILWNYFQDTFNNTSDTFFINSAIFGKVYFPRLIIPLSRVLSGLIKFFIQLSLLVVVYLYYYYKGINISFNITAFLIPVYILLMAGLSLGLGIIFSSLTTKYRDFKFLITFGVQLLMYATPIIYPITSVPPQVAFLIKYNPITYIVEAFRYSIYNTGYFSTEGLIYSTLFTVLVLLVGVIIFNRTESNFMDTV